LTNSTLDTPDTPLLPPEHFIFLISLDNLYNRIFPDPVSVVHLPLFCYNSPVLLGFYNFSSLDHSGAIFSYSLSKLSS